MRLLVKTIDILPALRKGRGFRRGLVWFEPLSAGSCFSLTAPHRGRPQDRACPAPRSCDKKNYTKNLRLVSQERSLTARYSLFPVLRLFILIAASGARSRLGYQARGFPLPRDQDYRTQPCATPWSASRACASRASGATNSRWGPMPLPAEIPGSRALHSLEHCSQNRAWHTC